jgi:predicted DNA-binding transcriptional regulator AlpA
MTTILQMNQEDLQTAIKNCLRESIDEIKRIPSPEPLPDRITLLEACELTGSSKSQIYKLSMLNQIPVSHFGKRLIFSRKKLIEWMESRTISTLKDTEIIPGRVSAAAKKHLKK